MNYSLNILYMLPYILNLDNDLRNYKINPSPFN